MTMTADSLPGMLLPDLAPRATDNVRVYRNQPQGSDDVTRGALTGKRVESWTYVCQEGGAVDIPATRVHWLNPDNQRWSVAELPAVEFFVEGDVAASAAMPETSSRNFVTIPFLLAGLAVVGWLLRKQVLARNNQRGPETEADVAQFLIASCGKQPPAEMLRYYDRWLRLLGNRKPGTATELARMHIGLQRKVIGRNHTWDADAFADLIKAYRSTLRVKRQHKSGTPLMTALNDGWLKS
jgi:hypothetical protein